MNREERKKIALDTLLIIDKGFYKTRNGRTIDIKNDISHSVTNTKLYTPDELSKLKVESHNSNCIFDVTRESSLEACKKLYEEGVQNIGCLNFASARNPGGGFLNGSLAQEESLARSSSLVLNLKKDDTMYRKNKSCNSLLYTDYIIFSPSVTVFKDDEGEYLEKPYKVSFITSPAPNLKAIKKAGDMKDLQNSRKTLERRIEYILRVAENEKINSLVLGAYGCGVFGWDSDVVASLFKRILNEKFNCSFKKVVFAIYSKGVDAHYNSFSRLF